MYGTKNDMIHAIKSYYGQWMSTSDNKPFKVYHYDKYDLYTIRKTYSIWERKIKMKYVCQLNEVVQQAVELMIRDIAQMEFLDKEETESAIQHAIDSKVNDLNEVFKIVGVNNIDELVAKYI